MRLSRSLSLVPAALVPVLLVAVGLVSACGTPAADLDAGALPGDGGSPPDAQPADAASDAGGQDGSALAPCAGGEACSVGLAPDGTCPGTCVAAPLPLACRAPAVVAHGVCFGDGPRAGAEPTTRDGVRVEVISAPDDAFPGEEHEVHLRVTNERATALTTSATLTTGPGWEIVELLEPIADATIAPGAFADLRVRVRATETTILAPVDWALVRVGLSGTAWGGRGYQVDAPVLSRAGEIECGAQRFPSSLPIPTENPIFGYASARCVDGVFFPNASCVDTSECSSGVCADGLCVDAAPFLAFGESALAGHHRVLVVMADQDDIEAGDDPCADRADELRERLELDASLGWLARMLEHRAGRTARALDVRVLAGFDTDDFLPGAAEEVPHARWVEALEDHLVALGCVESFGAEAGRVVTVSGRSDAGSRVTTVGRVHLVQWHPWVFLHEVLHTFGATDLYWHMGGLMQWRGMLMTTAAGPAFTGPGEGDHVTWAEIGLADLDRDGVIDSWRRPRGESLHLGEASARLARGRALTITLPVEEERDGARHRVWPHDIVVELLDHGVVRRPRDYLEYDVSRTSVAFFLRADEVDLDAIGASSTLRIRVRAVRGFDDEDFERHLLRVDETLELPLTIR